MKCSLLLLIISLSNHCFAQELPERWLPAHQRAEHYFKVSKVKKMGAITFLEVGVISSSIGLIIMEKNRGPFESQEDWQRRRLGEMFFWAGPAAVSSSIPLFIASRRYKQKARLALKNETGFLPNPSGRHSFAALSFAISL